MSFSTSGKRLWLTNINVPYSANGTRVEVAKWSSLKSVKGMRFINWFKNEYDKTFPVQPDSTDMYSGWRLNSLMEKITPLKYKI